MGQVVEMPKPKIDASYCMNCGGPIGAGEPVVPWYPGWAHKFATTCEWHKEKPIDNR